jgi:hypothetical protein
MKTESSGKYPKEQQTLNNQLLNDQPPTDPQSTLEVEHTPIIVTDGSATIEFSGSHYLPDDDDPKNTNTAHDLKLSFIEAHRTHNSTDAKGSTVCYVFLPGEEYEIEVTCQRIGQGNKNFKVRGSVEGPPVKINFDHDEYKTPFTPIMKGNRVGHPARRPTKLEIFRDPDGKRESVHDCPLVSDTNCVYKVWDPHAHA